MVTVKLDMTKLLQIERNLGVKADQIVGKLAMDCETYIKTNWSSSSPSSPGEPPAVDTGNLTNNTRADREKEGVWVVDVGTDYAADLEFGTSKMAARPFLLPAVEAVANGIPNGLLQEIVK